MNSSHLRFKDALLGELTAAGKYNMYSIQARNEGLSYYADIFDELAGNELAHAHQIYKLLYAKNITADNLKSAIDGETIEFTILYPELAQIAVKEGNLEAARIFKQIGKIEKHHSVRLKKMLELLDRDMVYERIEPIRWKCDVCGYEFKGKKPPSRCPACAATVDHYFPQDLKL